MVEVNLRLIFLVVFTLGLAIFLYWDRENVERHFIIFYRRTKTGVNFIDRIAKKSPRFWNLYGWAGVLTGIISIVISLGAILSVAFQMFMTKSVQNGPSLIAPGLVSETNFQPGVTFVPVEYWVIGVGIIMFVHEISHGIVARTEGFEINSVGWILVGILPGAFVEPKGENMLPGNEENEDESTGMWEQGSWKSRLKVLGAGSFANYLTAGFFLLLVTATFQGVTQTVTSGYIGIQAINADNGLNYRAQKGYPAYKSGMRNGTLESIEGVNIRTLQDLENVSGRIQPGEEITVKGSEGTFKMKAIKNTYTSLKEPFNQQAGFWNWFISLLQTVAMLNLLIGLFNMLPVKPLDGGLIIDTLIKEFWKESKVKYLHMFSALTWAFIIASLLLGLIMT